MEGYGSKWGSKGGTKDRILQTKQHTKQRAQERPNLTSIKLHKATNTAACNMNKQTHRDSNSNKHTTQICSFWPSLTQNDQTTDTKRHHSKTTNDKDHQSKRPKLTTIASQTTNTNHSNPNGQY